VQGQCIPNPEMVNNGNNSIPQQYDFGDDGSLPYPNEGEILIVVSNIDEPI